MENAKIISMLQAAVNKEYDRLCNAMRGDDEVLERIYAYSYSTLAMLMLAIINSDDTEESEDECIG